MAKVLVILALRQVLLVFIEENISYKINKNHCGINKALNLRSAFGLSANLIILIRLSVKLFSSSSFSFYQRLRPNDFHLSELDENFIYLCVSGFSSLCNSVMSILTYNIRPFADCLPALKVTKNRRGQHGSVG